MKRLKPFAASAFAFAFFAGIVVALDYPLALSVNMVFLSVVCVLGILLGLTIFAALKDSACFIPWACFFAFMTVLPFLDLSPVKPFRRLFGSIHQGMSKDELILRLHAQFPVEGRFPIPSIRESESTVSFCLDPNDGRYNSEFIQVKLAGGTVVSCEYLPD